MTDVDAAIFADLFALEGASTIQWQQASRCTCWSDDTKQPQWGHEVCGGKGIIYADPVEITGLFRSQSRWVSARSTSKDRTTCSRCSWWASIRSAQSCQ